MKYYFSYGSNLNYTQMKRRCPTAKIVGIAILKNWRLSFVGRSKTWQGGVATIEKRKFSKAYGVVYKITNEDLENLDIYEGCPVWYKRFTVKIKLANGKVIKAESYHLPNQKPVYPSPDYYNIIAKGYLQFGLNLQELLKTLHRVKRLGAV